MSLLFKTDTVYTGVAQARHILELLDTPEAKLSYVGDMLDAIKSPSSYPTLLNINSVVDKLLAHIKAVQSNGAKVLSVSYTLKAIIFMLSNSLPDSKTIAVSPDFGIGYNNNLTVQNIFSLGGGVFRPLVATLKKSSVDSFNSLSAEALGATYVMSSTNGIVFSEGLLVGQCVNMAANNSPLHQAELRDKAAGSAVMAAKIRVARTTANSNLIFSIPTTTANAVGYSKTVTLGDQNAHKNAGLAAVFKYGTTSSKAYFNGAEVISNTESNTMLSLSTKATVPVIQSASSTENLIEIWFVDSNSETIAKALSNHLNRQDMAIVQ